jgi:hypothetical protein
MRLTVELRRRAKCDEELAAVGIFAGIAHCNLRGRRITRSGLIWGTATLTTPRSVNFCCSPAFSSLKVPPQML